MEQKKGKKATNFLIRIYFQRNCSWQGEIKWLDPKQGKSAYFRSFLELIFLLQSAVEDSEDVEAKECLRSWEQLAAEGDETSPEESRKHGIQTENHEVGEVND